MLKEMSRTPDPVAVEVLEDLLAKARRGEIREVALLYKHMGQWAYTRDMPESSELEFLGFLEWFRHQVLSIAQGVVEAKEVDMSDLESDA